VNSEAKQSPSLLGIFAVAWGVGGVVILLGRSIYSLAPMALRPLETGMQWWHWLAYVLCAIGMAYSEGYKGFQKAFSPRVVLRGMHLARHPSPLHVLLAPLFCMGLFHATRKRLIVSWSITAGVVSLICLVRLVDQPWRGIIDVGVVIGLSWGTIAILVFAVRAMRGKPPLGAADLPVTP